MPDTSLSSSSPPLAQPQTGYELLLPEGAESAGVGLRVARGEGGAVEVCGRSSGGDAALEGIGDGDVVTHVDGVPLAGKGDAAVKALLLGSPGTKAELGLVSGGVSYTVLVTRGGEQAREVRGEGVAGVGLWLRSNDDGGLTVRS